MRESLIIQASGGIFSLARKPNVFVDTLRPYLIKVSRPFCIYLETVSTAEIV